MNQVSIIGAGTMGNGIAQSFALNGFQVFLIDIQEENLSKAEKTISENLERMIKKEIINQNHKENTLSKIRFQTSMNEDVKNSDLVIEAVTESESIKLEIFKELDTLCDKKTILATNTSSISIRKIANVTKRPEKVIGMHFMNPVPIMKLVEVIKSDKTNDQTIETIIKLSERLKKIPVLVNDSPGFVANRILLPMINEALHTLEEGVSGVAEIDTVMILGMSHPMGPLQLADFIGLDVCLSILEVLYDGFQNEKYKPNKILKTLVEHNELGLKTKKGFYNYENGMKNKKVSERFKK